MIGSTSICASIWVGPRTGDEKPDLAIPNYDAEVVSVLANRGDGSFEAKRDFTSGHLSYSGAIGDLNGDGKPDVGTANELGNSVSVLLNATGLCGVPNLKGKTLPAAERTIARAGCRVGTIRRGYSKTVKRGRVISEKPKPGAVLPNGGKVNLVVSRGRRR